MSAGTKIVAVAVFALGPGAPSVVLAQTVPRDQINRPLGVERALEAGETLDDRKIGKDATARPCGLDDETMGGARIYLTGVTFEVDDARAARLLNPVGRDQLGLEIAVSNLCSIRDDALEALSAAGYIADIGVRPQALEAGNLRMQVALARLKAIEVRGMAQGAEEDIEALMAPAIGKIINTRDLERRLLAIGRLPGLSAAMTLVPAGNGANGDLLGIVTVRFARASFTGSLSNLEESYPALAVARAEVNGLFGGINRTSLAALTSSGIGDYSGASLEHRTVLAQRFEVQGRVTRIAIRERLEGLTIGVDSLLATLSVSGTLLGKGLSQPRFRLGIDLYNQNSRFLDFPLSRDRNRIVFAEVAFGRSPDELSAFGFGRRFGAGPAISGSVEARRGLAILGATNCRPPCFGVDAVPPQRFDADSTATVTRAEIRARYNPTPTTSVFLSASAQHAHEPVAASEEFVGGNYSIGRGYGAAVLSGDRVIGAQLEAQFGAFESSARGVLAFPFAFFDVLEIDNFQSEFNNSRTAKSVGAGVRVFYKSALSGEAFVAYPFDAKEVLIKRKAKLFATLTYRTSF